MLKKLYVKDFAIVDHLEIEFESGFQVVTGETGAGKSILVGALGLLCGERGQPDLVRSGADKAILEAEFKFPSDGKKKAILEELAIDSLGDVIIIRREINIKGVSRAFINDTPVNISALSTLTGILIDLHGQHQHQRLIHPEYHITYLDAYGRIQTTFEGYKAKFKEYHSQKNLFESLIEERKVSYEKHDLYTFQVEELSKANLKEKELESLVSERKILENNEILFDVSNKVATLLYSAEDSGSNRISEAINKLKSMVDVDPSFTELIKNLESAQVSVEETGRQCQSYGSNLEFNPDRLEEIRNRESELEWLLKKYQVSNIPALIKRHEAMKTNLDALENFDEKIEELDKKLEEIRKELQDRALDLSQKRQELGNKFEKELEELLISVGLQNATFQVSQSWQEKENGLVAVNGKQYELSENGLDQIEFHVGLNVGEPTRPLHKVASGGEVSRIMLCIKTLLADSDDIATLVFDEIDSGISGRFAQIVGKKMLEIARHHQLIVITHLPQIAAQGESHYSVIKREVEGRTIVSVQKLKIDERILDIAKLLGGEQVTPQAIANAKELLQSDIDVPLDEKIAEILKI
jgi:DNA repair protein RecN (Recombination protein N)